MKRIIGLFLAAIIGGFVAFLLINIFVEKDEVENLSDGIISNSNREKIVSKDAINLTDAANKSINTVVHIKTQTEQEALRPSILDLFDYYGLDIPSQKRIQLATGSGVIISQDGYIVTNNHVINNANSISIVLNDKREFEAILIGKDKATDLAVLKIDAVDLPFIKFGNSDNLQIGEWVLAVGNPFNLTSTVTAGIVSAKGRDININTDMFALESFIQTDAAVNQGNSGGALVNSFGDLVGINTAIASKTGAYSGYSFAIPVNIVKKVISDIIDYGIVHRAYIGIEIQDMNSELANEIGISDLKGVYVKGLLGNGAAASAGIKVGDVILKVNDINVNKVTELQEQIGKYRPGDKVKVTLNRKNKEITFDVVLRNKEGNIKINSIRNNNVEKSFEVYGATIRELSDSEKEKLGIDNGLKVTSLNSGKFKNSDMKNGFIIMSIDKERINNISDLKKILKSKKGGILIEGIYPDGEKRFYALGL